MARQSSRTRNNAAHAAQNGTGPTALTPVEIPEYLARRIAEKNAALERARAEMRDWVEAAQEALDLAQASIVELRPAEDGKRWYFMVTDSVAVQKEEADGDD